MESKGKEKRLRALWEYFAAKVDANKNVIWRSPKKWELAASLYAIEVEGKDSRELLAKLYDAHGIISR